MIPEFWVPLDIWGLCLSLAQALVRQKADRDLVCAHGCVHVFVCAHMGRVHAWGCMHARHCGGCVLVGLGSQSCGKIKLGKAARIRPLFLDPCGPSPVGPRLRPRR